MVEVSLVSGIELSLAESAPCQRDLVRPKTFKGTVRMMNGHEHRRNAYHAHGEDETPYDDLNVDVQPQDRIDGFQLTAIKHVDHISASSAALRTSCCRS